MLVEKNRITTLLPHRDPMIMIDHLLFCDDRHSKTGFTISKKNIFCAHGRFSEEGLIENMAQTALAGSIYNLQNKKTENKTGYLASVSGFFVHRLPEINETIVTETELTDNVFGISKFKAKIFAGENCIAEGELKVVTTEIS